MSNHNIKYEYRQDNICLDCFKQNDSNSNDYNAIVYSYADEEIILSFGQIEYIKLFWNETLIFDGLSSKHAFNHKIIVHIKKGNNTIRYEVACLHEESIFKIVLESLSQASTGFFKKEYLELSNDIYIAEKPFFLNKPYTFSIFATNTTAQYLDCKVSVQIIGTETPQFFNVVFNQAIQLPFLDTDIAYVTVQYVCDGNDKCKSFYIVSKHHELIEHLEKSYKDNAYFQKLKSLFYDKKHLNTCQTFLFSQLYMKIVCWEKTKIFDYVFYNSQVDNKPNEYLIKLPEGYDINKTYSLILNIATDFSSYEQGFFLEKAMKICRTDVVIAMVNIKGITLGSFIGEAFFLEVLRHIEFIYNIDKSHISLTGYSNGAYAVWSIAQRYPDLFSSIAVLSGASSLDYLCNLHHMPVLCIGSKKDYEFYNGFYAIQQCFDSRNPDTKFILLENDLHSSFYWYYMSSSIVDWLLLVQIETNIFTYKTRDITNSKTKYFRILEIKDCQYDACIKIIYKFSSIYLILGNICAIEIYTQNFDLSYNSIHILWDQTEKCIDIIERKSIILLKTDGEIIVSKAPIAVVKTESFHQSLLNIYYKPVKIMVSNNNPFLMQSAYNFSSPYSSGWNDKISVKYPIEVGNNINYELTNVIFLTDNANDALLKQYASKENMIITETSFHYKELHYTGDYLLAFISNLIQDESYSILCVYTNQLKLFNKSIFTRHFVLPSNVNSKDYVFNTKLFIYTGKKYLFLDA